MVTTGRLETIRSATQYLEQHITDARILRHAAGALALLSSWGVADDVQMAAILSPLIRQHPNAEKQLLAAFGTRPMNIARIALKFGAGYTFAKSTSKDINRIYADKLRNLFTCAYIDLESALVCLADRLTLASDISEIYEELPEVERIMWAAETLAVDVPLLEMLGMWEIRQHIANLALHFYDTGLHSQYEYYVAQYLTRHQSVVCHIREVLFDVFSQAGINLLDIRIHETSGASLYHRHQRATKRGRGFDPAEVGILRIDVLVAEVRDCYYGMGELHALWKPTSSSLVKDEIASPRYNGYRALTTTVHCDINKMAVEFRFITPEIAKVNQKGVLTRRKVKNAWWLKDYSGIVGTSQTGRLEGEMCVFTPIGEVIHPLKPGTTLVDVAFKIHSDLGPYARRFWVNGRTAPYNARVNHRDIIEIEYDTGYVSLTPEWETVAQSRTARSNIKRFLRGKVSFVHRGRTLLDAVIQREYEIYRLSFSPDQVEALLSNIALERGFRPVEALYANIAKGDTAPDMVVADMIEHDLKSYINMPEDIAGRYAPEISFARTWMQLPRNERNNRNVRIYPGTPIVGRLISATPHTDPNNPPTRWRLVVYRANSTEAAEIPTEQRVPLTWGGENSQQEAMQVSVIGTARPGVAWSVLNEVERACKGENDKITVSSFHADRVNGVTNIEMTLETSIPNYTAELKSSLENLKALNLIKSFKLFKLFPGERMLLNSMLNHQQMNPYRERHIEDESMFFGRESQIREIIFQLRSDREFIILHGHKRIGKTSLMIHLATHVELKDACGVLPILFDMHSAAPLSAQSFVKNLLATAEKIVRAQIRRDEWRELRVSSLLIATDPFKALVDWVQRAEVLLRGPRIFFMIDEFTAAEDAYRAGMLDDSFFDRLQAIVDAVEVRFLLCIHNSVLRDKTSRTTNMFQRAHMIAINELDRADARMLVRQLERNNTPLESGVEDRILELTNCHPFFIHIVCSDIMSQLAADPSIPAVTMAHLKVAVHRVLQSAFHHFALYTNMMNEHSWYVLDSLVILTGEHNRNPVALKALIEKVQAQYPDLDSKIISNYINDLYELGVIVKEGGAHHHPNATYRVAMDLLHIWRSKGTDHLPNTEFLNQKSKTTGTHHAST